MIKLSKLQPKILDKSSIQIYLDFYNNIRIENGNRFFAPRLNHEKQPGEKTTIPEAYICFRKRTDKRVQTRRNRRNDEQNFEKLIRLRSELNSCKHLFSSTHKREKLKKDHVYLSQQVIQARGKDQSYPGDTIRKGILDNKFLNPTVIRSLTDNSKEAREEIHDMSLLNSGLTSLFMNTQHGVGRFSRKIRTSLLERRLERQTRRKLRKNKLFMF